MDELEPERRVLDYSSTIVEDLAAGFDVPFDEIVDAYETQLVRLEREARVKGFVPIIAAHQVRVALIQHRDQQDAPDIMDNQGATPDPQSAR